MRKKHRRSIIITAMAYLFLWSCGTSTNVWATTAGHFTDLLPNPTSVGTSITSGTMYYNGYDWQVTSLGASATAGDALSRAPFTGYQVYTSSAISNTTNVTTFTAIASQSAVGSRTFPVAWIASGRSIRFSVKGRYQTTSTPNWTWAIALGSTTIVTTGAIAAPLTQAGNWFTAEGIVTISTTGASGTANASYTVLVGSGTIGTNNVVSYSTTTAAAVAVDLTSQVQFNPSFTWGTASASNVLTVNNMVVEFLN